MDTLIISNENNILHIFNDGDKYDYTVYNSKGHNMDGGVLELDGEMSSKESIDEIIKMVQDRFLFNAPYTCLSGEKAQNLLELIEMEDYKNLQHQIESKSVSNKEVSDIEINI